MRISIIDTSSLGDRSYLIDDGGVAVVVDPQRDIDRVLALAAERDATITHVLETHIHNDYVTGGLELSRLVDAEYVVPAGDDRKSLTGPGVDFIGGQRLPARREGAHIVGATPQQLPRLYGDCHGTSLSVSDR